MRLGSIGSRLPGAMSEVVASISNGLGPKVLDAGEMREASSEAVDTPRVPSLPRLRSPSSAMEVRS